MTDKTQAILPVTQADRDAAAALIAWHNKAASDWKTDGGNDLTFFAANMPDAIRKGVWDSHDVVQAFARHRISHSLPGDIEAEVNRLMNGLRHEFLVDADAVDGVENMVRLSMRRLAALTPSALSGDAGEGG